ncbi:MAG: insulinase family protein [Candidatus Cloacimonetes bacterium]|nr:insulinase family protein [Candidatus Cloacimonadota bacterium]
MKKQAVKHGFAHIETREIPEIAATAHYYEHMKSGARLVHLASEDNNKVFCATFKTVPTDNTGCPHILEHSVLNGSKNFPAKSTFMELIKGSLHTFINAMTDSDMTMYPVASTNAKDFVNLSRVYLDAVFFPKIYEQPNILHQEGWHYELTGPDDELKLRGVVYNEMRGAFSAPDSIIERYNQQAQFPDNTYGCESGGDPKEIPQLTYEDFIAFHSKHYHPSNSHLFLYGDMDADALMEIMDKEYLSHFSKDTEAVTIPAQKPFDRVKKLEVQYPVEDGKDITEQYHLSLNFTYGQNPDLKTTQAIAVLMNILMRTPASPLKQAILKSGLARDTSYSLREGLLQPTFSIICKQVKRENIAPLLALIQKELKRLVKEGIDKKLVEAVINHREFALREGQASWGPKGLYYAWTMYPHWLHGGDPLEALGFEDSLKELRRGLSEPYYEQLIQQAMLKNHHSSQIIYVPVPGLANQWDSDLKSELAATKKKMSKSQIDKLVQFNQEFSDWQKEEPSAEDLEKIPMLSLKDINPEAESYPTEVDKFSEFTLLKHEQNTNGIVYLRAYFDLSHAEEEDLPWISLYTQLVGQVDSRDHGYAELSNEINIHTGDIKLGLMLRNSYQDPDEVLPKLVLTGKAVAGKSGKLMELAAEVALRPVFADRDRLKLLIRETKSKLETMLFYTGHNVAINRMLAPFSQVHRYSDMTGGLEYYHFLSDLAQKLDTDIDAIAADLDWVRENFFSRKNLLISITSDADGIAEAFQQLRPIVEQISTSDYAPVERHFHASDLNEAILAPVQVQYCVKGGNFFRKGYSYSGKLRVLNSILSNEFLHREIREKGGAYGAWSAFSIYGNMYFCSYRDPNLQETLDTYDKVPQFIRSFDCSRREMEKYIIGDISSLDYPQTPERKGALADDDYITGFTQADRQQIREEVLSTRIEDMSAYADMVEAILVKNHFCVFGNEAKLREAEKLFDRLTPVFS